MVSITRSGAVLALGTVLLLVPALLPVQPVLFHDTSAGTFADRAELEREGLEIVASENLSDRGQELYVLALRNDGYAVPVGAGASDFEYPTDAELQNVTDPRERLTLGRIVIERPPDADLPPADEPTEAAERERERRERRQQERQEQGGQQTPTPGTPTPSIEERRQQIARYDVMSTRTTLPAITETSSLARLFSILGGVILIGTGGYLRSKP